MASSAKSHKELMKQDVPITFDAIFSPNCLLISPDLIKHYARS